MPKKKTSFTLSEEAMQLLKGIAQKMGVSMSAALEVMIRLNAEKHNPNETP